MFRYIDMENWDRREYYEHYMHAVRCSYSMTVNLDITELLAAIKGKVSLYPVMIYFLSVLVNRHEEFRYAVKAGRVGVYDALHPSYTIFYKESETFSCIWTRFEEEFAAFYRAYLCDKEAYGQAAGLVPSRIARKTALTFRVSRGRVLAASTSMSMTMARTLHRFSRLGNISPRGVRCFYRWRFSSITPYATDSMRAV